MLSKDSETGKKVSKWFSDYQDFAKPNRGRDEVAQEVETFCETGLITEPDFQESGNCKVMLVYGDKQQAVILAPSLQDCLNVMGDYTVKGIKQGGVVVAESVELSAGPAVADVPAGQGELAGVGY